MIPPALASFLQDGVGIHVGTRDDRLRPNGARALAVRVDEDGTHLTVYIATVAAPRILPDLETNGEAAVSFGRPTDDRACQVKGTFADSRAATESEREFVLAQWNGFVNKLEFIGIARAALARYVTWPAVAIRLKATALFEQTPGPDAGVAMR